MDSVSAASLDQAAMSQIDARTQVDVALLDKAQELEIQQASAAVELIEAASSVVDIRV